MSKRALRLAKRFFPQDGDGEGKWVIGWKLAGGEWKACDPGDLSNSTTGDNLNTVMGEIESKIDLPKPKKRARKSGGKFKADDPSTPDVNEAFEQDPPKKATKKAAKKKRPKKK